MVELTQGRCYWRKGGAVFELEKLVYSCDSYWDLDSILACGFGILAGFLRILPMVVLHCGENLFWIYGELCKKVAD